MLGAYAGAGALAGVGQGMVHQDRLDEAYQMEHTKNNYAQDLKDNLADNQIRVNAAKYQQDLTAGQKDRAGMSPVTAQVTQAMPIQQPQEQAQAPGAAPQPGMPLQPRTPTLPQGGQQQASNQPDYLTQLNGAQGGEAPPPSQVPPTAPSSMVAGQADTAHTLETKDPYDIMANSLATGKDSRTGQPAFSQNAHDDYMNLHLQYKNIKPESLAAAYNEWAPANGDAPKWDSYKEFTKHLTDLDKAAQKEPITEEHLSRNEQDRYSVLKNNGDLPDEPVQAAPLSNTDKNIRSKNAMVAQRVEQGSTTAMDSLLRQAGLQGKYESGIGAGTIADFSNTVASWFGAGQTDKVAAAQQMSKESIDQMVAMMQTMPPGTRQGAQMAKYDLQGVADLTKGTEPNMQVINGIFGKSLMMNQNAYIQRTAGRYENQEQIDQLSARYSENNPPFLADGTTPNPKWMSAKDWISAGGPSGNVTEQGNLATGRSNIDVKKTATVKGENPSEVGNKTTQEKPFDYSAIKQGTTYTAPDGSTRTKQ